MHHLEVKTEEEHIDIIVPTSSVCMSSDAMNDEATFRNAMYPACSIHNIYFRMLFNEKEFEFAETLSASVDLVLAESPYHIICVREVENCNHESFALVDKEAISKH